MNIDTLAVHLGREIESHTGAVTPSITLATTFQRQPDGTFPEGKDVYTRASNPNRNALERTVAALEGGSVGIAFGSGMAAANALLMALSSGDHIVLPDDLYHGVRYASLDVFSRWGLQVSFVDMTDADNIANALRPTTKLVWVETPSNPLLKITDIRRAAALAHQAGALCVCDNTWATPILCGPLELGCDIVWHSTTKYFGGHSDVLGGIIVANDENNDLIKRVRQNQMLGGGVPSPFDCWLISRSIPTLPHRVRIATATANKIAHFLNGHAKVSVVHYPALDSHPGHTIAKSQMSDWGAMLSFELKGGRAAALALTGKVKVFTHATSLGGVESLLEHRASGEGPVPRTPPGLLRVSIGLENVDDLIADLDQALA